MLRNLYMRKVLPPLPTRSWRKNTGPFGSSTLISTAMIANSQQKATRTIRLNAMSKQRFARRYPCLPSMPATVLPANSFSYSALSALHEGTAPPAAKSILITPHRPCSRAGRAPVRRAGRPGPPVRRRTCGGCSHGRSASRGQSERRSRRACRPQAWPR